MCFFFTYLFLFFCKDPTSDWLHWTELCLSIKQTHGYWSRFCAEILTTHTHAKTNLKFKRGRNFPVKHTNMSILRACQCSPRVGMKLFTSLSVCARLIDKQFPSFLENPHKGFPYQYPDYLCFVGNQSRYDLNAKMHWGKAGHTQWHTVRRQPSEPPGSLISAASSVQM